MRLLFLFCSMLMLNVACSTDKGKYVEQKEEARQEYNEEVQEAEEEYSDAQKEEAEEFLEESESAKIKKDEGVIEVEE